MPVPVSIRIYHSTITLTFDIHFSSDFNFFVFIPLFASLFCLFLIGWISSIFVFIVFADFFFLFLSSFFVIFFLFFFVFAIIFFLVF